MKRVSSTQTSTPTCLLLTFLRILVDMYLRGDQTDGVGDLQKVEEDDRELVEDEDEEEVDEEMSKSATAVWDGVLSSFGDFSQKSSL